MLGKIAAVRSVQAGRLMLREYQASEQLKEREALYRSWDSFRSYWDEERWLTLDIDRGEPCVRASHYVGLLPFQRDGQSHLIQVAPKGCEVDQPVGLLRCLVRDFQFAVSPLDRSEARSARIAVLGLNLLQPLGK